MALLGAILLVLADTLGRTVAAPTQLPAGLLAAPVGRRTYCGCCTAVAAPPPAERTHRWLALRNLAGRAARSVPMRRVSPRRQGA
ncbi:hypothetical protein [Mumia sp. Pv 4-285]|uniref:hypothetical protein n=1 Tax=Mumia qirimensis TaxID=3234852 RepID=UPI00351D4BAB